LFRFCTAKSKKQALVHYFILQAGAVKYFLHNRVVRGAGGYAVGRATPKFNNTGVQKPASMPKEALTQPSSVADLPKACREHRENRAKKCKYMASMIKTHGFLIDRLSKNTFWYGLC
jgi:hypothetical protein